MDKFKSDINLHNPPFNYFSTVYITLVTIVQGLVFTAIMSLAIKYFADSNSGKTITSIIRVLDFLNAMVVVLVIWHKYANHHQITGWQITVKDTTILFQ